MNDKNSPLVSLVWCWQLTEVLIPCGFPCLVLTLSKPWCWLLGSYAFIFSSFNFTIQLFWLACVIFCHTYTVWVECNLIFLSNWEFNIGGWEYCLLLLASHTMIVQLPPSLWVRFWAGHGWASTVGRDSLDNHPYIVWSAACFSFDFV